jgi:hypothetical protein
MTTTEAEAAEQTPEQTPEQLRRAAMSAKIADLHAE